MNDEKTIDQYLPFLESRLTPPRLKHSLGVMQVMEDLTPIYLLDRVQAMTAGILHDIARDLNSEQQLAIAEEVKIELRHPCERHPVYLHALVGSHLVEKELGITDHLILDAIAAHSFAGNGHNFDSLLSQCLRIADLLAPIQEWKGMKKLGELLHAKRLDEATLLHCGWEIETFYEQRIPVHPNLIGQYQNLSRKLSVTKSFFDRW